MGLLYTPLSPLQLPVLHGRTSCGALAATQASFLTINVALVSDQVSSGWWKHLWMLVMSVRSQFS